MTIFLIYSDIKRVLLQFLYPNVIAALLGIVLTLLYERISNRRIDRPLQILLRFLLYAYLCYVAEVTLLVREAGSRTDVNLKLFGTFAPNPMSIAFMAENILLFFPFGLLLPAVSKRTVSFGCLLAISAFCSSAIEVIQHLTERGYLQLDDIWLNVLGAAAGYAVYRGIRNASERNKKK